MLNQMKILVQPWLLVIFLVLILVEVDGRHNRRSLDSVEKLAVSLTSPVKHTNNIPSPTMRNNQLSTEFLDHRNDYQMPEWSNEPEENTTQEVIDKWAVLSALYESTNGPYWMNNTGWLDKDISMCDWYGIGCIPDQPGIFALLASNNLTGTLPNWDVDIPNTYSDIDGHGGIEKVDSIRRGLNLLQIFDVKGNEIGGTIPTGVCYMTSVGTLNLGNNQFEGPIPECIGNVKLVQVLDLYDNDLIGTLPESLFTLEFLELLLLDSNNLTGTLSPKINHIEALFSLDLGYNQLGGTLPIFTGGVLSFLELNNNNFEGSITPARFTRSPLLRKLDLSYNNFTGNITFIEKTTEITALSLSHNRFEGPLPSLQMTSTIYLDISHNNLSGFLRIDILYVATITNGLSYYSVRGNPMIVRDPACDKAYPFQLMDESTTQLGSPWTCKSTTIRGLSFPILLDPSYLEYEHCGCSRGFYGIAPICYPCPVGSSPLINCPGGPIVTLPDGMYPVLLNHSSQHLGSLDAPDDEDRRFMHPFDGHIYFEHCAETSGCIGNMAITLQKLKHVETSGVCDFSKPKPVPPPFTPNVSAIPTFIFGSPLCKPGHAGRLCSACICDHPEETCYFPRHGACGRCKSVLSPSAGLVLFFSLVFAILLIFTLIHTLLLRSKRVYKKKIEGKLKRFFYRVYHIRSIGYFKLLLIWLQTIAVVSSWPSEWIQKISSILRTASGDPAGLGMLCLWPHLARPLYGYIAILSIPPIIFIILATSILLAHFIWTCFFSPKHPKYVFDDEEHSESENFIPPRKKKEKEPLFVPNGSSISPAPTTSSDIESSSTSAFQSDMDAGDAFLLLTIDEEDDSDGMNPSGKRTHQSKRKQQQQQHKEGELRPYSAVALLCSELIALLYFFYFGLSLQTLSFFLCQKQIGSGIPYLQSIPWLSCQDDQVRQLRMVAWPVLGIITMGTPVLFASLLFYFRHRKHERRVADIIGGLYRCYKQETYWWEIIILLRRLILALVLRLVSTNSSLHYWFVILILTGSLLLQHHFKPFASAGENRAEEASLVLVILTYTAQVASNARLEARIPLFYLTISLDTVFMLGTLAFLLKQWFTQDIDKLIDED